LIRAELGQTTKPGATVKNDKSPPPHSLYTQMTDSALSEQLQKRFARRVTINCPHGQGGQIQFGFRDKEDRNSLVALLLNTSA
jgi:hypothetical protein